MPRALSLSLVLRSVLQLRKMSRTSIIFVLVATAAPIHGYLGYPQQNTRSSSRRPWAAGGALTAEPATSTGSSSGELLSGTKWRCEVDFGREKGTWMEPRCAFYRTKL